MTEIQDLPWLSGVRLRTIAGWYDGPRAGLAIHDGGTYWYEVHETLTDDEGNWGYVLYPLSTDEVAQELGRHEAFSRLVGTHLDLDEHGQLVGGEVLKDAAARAAFYERYPPGPSAYPERPGLGWFTVLPVVRPGSRDIRAR